MSTAVVCLQTEEIKSSLHNDGFCRTAWLNEMYVLLRDEATCQWRIGDCALRTPAEASKDEVRELLEEAAKQSGYDVNTIRELRTVAERIPQELRERGLSFCQYKEIGKLTVIENGKENKEKALELRAEFVERFAANENATVVSIRDAVRKRMGKKNVAAQETQTVSFKLTSAEFARLKELVDAHAVHASVEDFVQELVRRFLAGEVK
ncbi:MAG TPA: hypothetical protein VJN92_15560 [Candidatus Acidoferrum sp.]|nr:hypothetical protein [Candidatus Acidoferrum sp.]